MDLLEREREREGCEGDASVGKRDRQSYLEAHERGQILQKLSSKASDAAGGEDVDDDGREVPEKINKRLMPVSGGFVSLILVLIDSRLSSLSFSCNICSLFLIVI